MSITNNPKYIIIHCSDVSYKVLADQFNSINTSHRDERGFPRSSFGLYVGYQWLITGEKEYQCRLDTEEGAHCNQVINGLSMNFQSIGVCVGFDGDVEFPTSMQYALLQKRVWALQDKWGIKNENVRFHREFATTKTCPGSLITQAWLDELLKRPVPVVLPPKPVENMCVAQDTEIAELKKKLSWYDKLLDALMRLWR